MNSAMNEVFLLARLIIKWLLRSTLNLKNRSQKFVTGTADRLILTPRFWHYCLLQGVFKLETVPGTVLVSKHPEEGSNAETSMSTCDNRPFTKITNCYLVRSATQSETTKRLCLNNYLFRHDRSRLLV